MPCDSRSIPSSTGRMPIKTWILVFVSMTPSIVSKCSALQMKLPFPRIAPPTSSSWASPTPPGISEASKAWRPRGKAARQNHGSSKQQQRTLGLLPPEDGTFSLLQTLKGLSAGPGISDEMQARFDKMIRISGGVWRSKLLGIFSYVVSGIIRARRVPRRNILVPPAK